jgi:hypothetical protein
LKRGEVARVSSERGRAGIVARLAVSGEKPTGVEGGSEGREEGQRKEDSVHAG